MKKINVPHNHHRRLSIVIMFCAVLCLGLLGCSKQPFSDDFFKQLKDDTGHFAYPGLPFGSTPEQAQEVLGISLGEPNETQISVYGREDLIPTYYFPEKPVGSIYGLDVGCDLQFLNGGLWAITWGFNTDEEQDVENVLALLKETYGEPDTSQSNQVLNCTTQSNRWIVEGEDYFTSLTCSVSFNPAEGKKTPYSFAIGLMYNQWTDVEGNPYPEK